MSARVTLFALSMSAVVSTMMPASAYAASDCQGVLPPGWQDAVAMHVNDAGTVVGYGWDAMGNTKGFIHDGRGDTELLPENWVVAQAWQINERGAVVGTGVDGSGLDVPEKGFLYDKGIYTQLLPPGWSAAWAYGINKRDVVVGCGSSPERPKGFIYERGIYTEVLPPGWEAIACGGPMSISINDAGVVVGTGYVESAGVITVRNFTYAQGVYQVLPASGWAWTGANDLNNAGTVAGLLYGEGVWKGFAYREGTYTEILPPACDTATAYGINNRGAVVGTAECPVDGGSTSRGFVLVDGTYEAVCGQQWPIVFAYGINNRGVVVGRGFNGSVFQAFIATPQTPLMSDRIDGEPSLEEDPVVE